MLHKTFTFHLSGIDHFSAAKKLESSLNDRLIVCHNASLRNNEMSTLSKVEVTHQYSSDTSMVRLKKNLGMALDCARNLTNLYKVSLLIWSIEERDGDDREQLRDDVERNLYVFYRREGTPYGESWTHTFEMLPDDDTYDELLPIIMGKAISDVTGCYAARYDVDKDVVFVNPRTPEVTIAQINPIFSSIINEFISSQNISTDVQ